MSERASFVLGLCAVLGLWVMLGEEYAAYALVGLLVVNAVFLFGGVGEMIASKRKPLTPCEICAYWVESKQDGEMMCKRFRYRMTAADGCTRGKERGEQ